MSERRDSLNDILLRYGFELRGDFVVVRALPSETKEVRQSEHAVVAEMSAEPGSPFAPGGLRLERFRKNPIVLWAHDYDGLPIARSLWERVRCGDDADAADLLIVKAQFHRDTEISRETWSLVEDHTWGVKWELGVLPEEWEFTPGRSDVVVTKWDLVEISAAPGEECKKWITRRITNHKISSPTMRKSTEVVEPELKPAADCEEETSADEPLGPYSWRIRDYEGVSWFFITGPGLADATAETRTKAEHWTARLNNAFRHGRASAYEDNRPPTPDDPPTGDAVEFAALEGRVASLEAWRDATREKLARMREAFGDAATDLWRWGDGPGEEREA